MTSDPSTEQEPQRDDPFDMLLSLEDQYFNEGYHLGVADGARSGKIDGRLFGLEKGFEKALEMGRLNGRVVVWKAQQQSNHAPQLENDNVGRVLNCMNRSARLNKHIHRAAELTDPGTLETKNTEEAVNQFDERLAGARNKVTLISRIIGEDDGCSNSVPADSSTSNVARTQEEDLTSETPPFGDQKITRGSSKNVAASSEMEDFVGLPRHNGRR